MSSPNTGTLLQQKVWGSGQLEPGPHTVTITCTGAKNPSSNGTAINLDALDVTGVLTQAD